MSNNSNFPQSPRYKNTTDCSCYGSQGLKRNKTSRQYQGAAASIYSDVPTISSVEEKVNSTTGTSVKIVRRRNY